MLRATKVGGAWPGSRPGWLAGLAWPGLAWLAGCLAGWLGCWLVAWVFVVVSGRAARLAPCLAWPGLPWPGLAWLGLAWPRVYEFGHFSHQTLLKHVPD